MNWGLVVGGVFHQCYPAIHPSPANKEQNRLHEGLPGASFCLMLGGGFMGGVVYCAL